jgi:2'-5' RNA ligase
MVVGSGNDPVADGDDRPAERRQLFRHGALVLPLDGPEWAPIARARALFDPGSAALIGPHVTMTPPFVEAPSATALDRLRSIVAARLPMTLVIGGAGRFPASDVVYVRVEPRGPLVRLHEELLATGLFAAYSFAGEAFVPHVTISEFGVDPVGAARAISSIPAARMIARALAWVAPGAEISFVTRAVLP